MKWFVVEILNRFFIARPAVYVRVEANSAKEAAKIIRGRLCEDQYITVVCKEMKWR